MLSAEQTWPFKQWSGPVELISHVGLTQWNLMFADARPARAAIERSEVLIFDFRI